MWPCTFGLFSIINITWTLVLPHHIIGYLVSLFSITVIREAHLRIQVVPEITCLSIICITWHICDVIGQVVCLEHWDFPKPHLIDREHWHTKHDHYACHIVLCVVLSLIKPIKIMSFRELFQCNKPFRIWGFIVFGDSWSIIGIYCIHCYTHTQEMLN